MTASNSVFVSAPTITARELAEEMLALLGTPTARIATAEFHTAATESPEFKIPAGTDYHGYVPSQGLPVWLRVGVLDESYRAQVLADYDGSQLIREAMFGATHLARLVYSYGGGIEANVNAAIAQLADRYPLRWVDDLGALHR
ncbi:hypothetical protein H7I87_00570 [Mycobacterium timonense]|nr:MULTISPECIES: hypothetical protein [Mycobacterium avium complex (MAC)]MCV6988711.1 hypothetical protein [Mycobacterium bouchedurhonense]MCV6993259.1 hypothetical protein [Mycobacterium timonense]MDV3306620.1 hypothetical protein [Mycobacterium avium subsp. hominissuis]